MQVFTLRPSRGARHGAGPAGCRRGGRRRPSLGHPASQDTDGLATLGAQGTERASRGMPLAPLTPRRQATSEGRLECAGKCALRGPATRQCLLLTGRHDLEPSAGLLFMPPSHSRCVQASNHLPTGRARRLVQVRARVVNPACPQDATPMALGASCLASYRTCYGH